MTKLRRLSLPPRPPRRRNAVARIAALACLLTGAPAARAQLLQRPTAVVNARIVAGDGRVIENGTLLVQGERIAALGRDVKVPMLSRKIDAQGATVTAGLIDVWSLLGRTGESSGTAGPTRRAEDAFDRYDSAHLVDALRHGVTAVCLSPSGPQGVCGSGAVIRLAPGSDGPQSLGRVLKSQAALCIDLGSDNTPVTRLKTLRAVQKQFREALQYRQSLEQYEEDLAEYKKQLRERASKKSEKEAEKPEDKPKEEQKSKQGSASVPSAADEEKPKDEQAEKQEDKKEETALKKPQRPEPKHELEILLHAVDHELPVRILAHRSADILNALELARTFSLDLILEGGAEAHLVAAQIADAEVPVILGSTARNGLRQDDVFRRTIPNCGTVLGQAGVRWIVASGAEDAAAARFVLLGAQLAAASNRLNDPLRLVTADAAELLRVADQIGRLRPGLLADFVLWSGDPLDPASKVVRVYVGGTPVYQTPDEPEKGGAE
ncbi:MAG: amidohydrolase family protein [Pirellulales bacterium]|nr:amidohydrolase family protein [Pirellulales bacterium]